MCIHSLFLKHVLTLKSSEYSALAYWLLRATRNQKPANTGNALQLLPTHNLPKQRKLLVSRRLHLWGIFSLVIYETFWYQIYEFEFRESCPKCDIQREVLWDDVYHWIFSSITMQALLTTHFLPSPPHDLSTLPSKSPRPLCPPAGQDGIYVVSLWPFLWDSYCSGPHLYNSYENC